MSQTFNNTKSTGLFSGLRKKFFTKKQTLHKQNNNARQNNTNINSRQNNYQHSNKKPSTNNKEQYKSLLEDIKHMMRDYKERHKLMEYINLYFLQIIFYIEYKCRSINLWGKDGKIMYLLSFNLHNETPYNYTKIKNNKYIDDFIKKGSYNKYNLNELVDINKYNNIFHDFTRMNYVNLDYNKIIYYIYLNICKILNNKDNIYTHYNNITAYIDNTKYYKKIYDIIIFLPYLFNYIFNKLNKINYDISTIWSIYHQYLYTYYICNTYKQLIILIKEINKLYKITVIKIFTERLNKINRQNINNTHNNNNNQQRTRRRSIKKMLNRTRKRLGTYITRIKRKVQKQIYLFKNNYDLIPIKKHKTLQNIIDKNNEDYKETIKRIKKLYPYNGRNIQDTYNSNIENTIENKINKNIYKSSIYLNLLSYLNYKLIYNYYPKVEPTFNIMNANLFENKSQRDINKFIIKVFDSYVNEYMDKKINIAVKTSLKNKY